MVGRRSPLPFYAGVCMQSNMSIAQNVVCKTEIIRTLLDETKQFFFFRSTNRSLYNRSSCNAPPNGANEEGIDDR